MAEATFEALDRVRFVDEIPTNESEDDGIEASRITVFVDLLDGTREFVEGRVENNKIDRKGG